MVKKDKPKNIGPALHREPRRLALEKLRENILDASEEVFSRYVQGQSFERIAASLPFAVEGWRLREVLMSSEETSQTFLHSKMHRAHNLVEASIEYGLQAAAIGTESGLKVAIDTNLKVASKLNPIDYGDRAKVELTGKDGGALHVKADLTLTAEQAYERLIKGD